MCLWVHHGVPALSSLTAVWLIIFKVILQNEPFSTESKNI